MLQLINNLEKLQSILSTNWFIFVVLFFPIQSPKTADRFAGKLCNAVIAECCNVAFINRLITLDSDIWFILRSDWNYTLFRLSVKYKSASNYLKICTINRKLWFCYDNKHGMNVFCFNRHFFKMNTFSRLNFIAQRLREQQHFCFVSQFV